MRILYCGYRNWAKEILSNLKAAFPAVQFDEVETKEPLLYINYDLYDIIFFVGWSWIISDELVSTDKCVCLHPSPLPKYRGGSPLQNQIIAGETHSSVSLFIMDEGLDTGPILYAIPFSLEGDLADVIDDMVESSHIALGSLILFYLTHGKFPEAVPQEHSSATIYKRRKPSESEITPAEIASSTALRLHNKIRSLQDPYPNAFITCGDGSKLYLVKSRI